LSSQQSAVLKYEIPCRPPEQEPQTGSLNRPFSGQALRDDNLRLLCRSLVGANGRSPEKGPGWNLMPITRKMGQTIGAFGSQSADAGQSPSVASRTSCGQFRLCRAEEQVSRNGLLRSGCEYRVVEAGYKNRFMKSGMLKQVKTNL